MSENLVSKLVNVMSALGDVPKRGHYSEGNTKYDFMQADDIFGKAQSALAISGVMIFTNIIGCTQTEVVSRSGTKGRHVLLDMQFDITDGETTLSSAWKSEAIDYGDKSITKAVTLGRKYFLISLFQLATGDGRDDNDSTDTNAENAKPTTTKVVSKATPKPAAQPKLGKNLTVEAKSDGITPAEAIRYTLDDIISNYSNPDRLASESQIKFLGIMLRSILPDHDQRHQVCTDIFGVENLSDIPGSQVCAMLDFLNITKDEAGKGVAAESAVQDILNCLTE